MIEVGIITFHSAENSGAALQCFALQETLKKLGADTHIINYQPSYIRDQYRIFVNPLKKIKNEQKIKSFIAYSVQNLFLLRRLIRKWKFKAFRKKYFNLTRAYLSLNELIKDPPKADIYICGSDQIWNPTLTGGDFDPAYFLQFGPSQVRRYSYAVSVGKELSEPELEKIYETARTFDGISFRESSVKDKFSEYFQKYKFDVCIDPTLLLDASDWERIIVSEKGRKRKYILVYALERNEAFQQIIDFVKENLGDLDVIDISQCNLKLKKYAKRQLHISPNEFLSYIHDAEFVITNSFHCTVFSVIFKRNFYTIQHSKSNSRLRDFLSNVKLSDRIYEGIAMDLVVEYDSVDTVLKEYKDSSMQFLEGLIGKD